MRRVKENERLHLAASESDLPHLGEYWLRVNSHRWGSSWMRSKHKTLLLEELILRDESTCRLYTPFELVFQTLLPYVMLRRTITIPLRWNRERCLIVCRLECIQRLRVMPLFWITITILYKFDRRPHSFFFLSPKLEKASTYAGSDAMCHLPRSDSVRLVFAKLYINTAQCTMS